MDCRGGNRVVPRPGRAGPLHAQAAITLLNVSYDPTRELYQDVNAAFAAGWKSKTGQIVTINQSHGGSGKQARAVIDGLQADIVTLALAYDIDAIRDNGRLIATGLAGAAPAEQQSLHVSDRAAGAQRQPEGHQGLERPGPPGCVGHHAQPEDLRWCALELPGGVGYALEQSKGDEARARDFVAKLYRNVPVLDSGARGSTTTFVQRGIGDVLVAWENEALLAVEKLGKGDFEIIAPSVSILAEPPVAVVDKVVDRRGTRKVAQAYLEFLYSPQGQEIAAKHYYRPRSEPVRARYAKQFPELRLFTVDKVFGGWAKAQKTHFGDGGVFDQIYQPGT